MFFTLVAMACLLDAASAQMIDNPQEPNNANAGILRSSKHCADCLSVSAPAGSQLV
jgi:hypothetical protein